MREPTADPTVAFRPGAAFRTALAAAAAAERAGRSRRPERVAALAALSDADLAQLAEQFERLLQGPTDVGALTERLHAALHALSPETAPDEEVDDA